MTRTDREGTNASGIWEGTAGTRSGRPTRRFLIVTGAIAVCAAVFTVAAALTSGNDPSAAAPGIVAAVTRTPEAIIATVTPERTLAPTPALTEAPATGATAIQPTGTVTPAIDGAWNATPEPSTETPPPTPYVDAVSRLISSIQAQYGVRIITGEQNWGSDEASQLRNLGAVDAALASVPGNVRTTNNANAAGLLTFLSNDGGRTEGGWQPYGNRAANFYSNEDIVAGSYVTANAIVLQPGSTAQTIAHEMMHAYQLRGQAPGDYAGALLTPELKSFMQATGWTQLVSDAELLAHGGSWDAVNAGFRYDGRTLAYHNEWGDAVMLYAPNPLEAYAEAGGLYYAHSLATTLPDWPEYWAWFGANIG